MEFSASADPLDLLLRFQAEAEAAGAPLANAMTLATVGHDGRPHARIVLFKGLRDSALLFFTNYESHKAQELEHSGYAALVFHFAEQERQVRVEGRVERTTASESDAYFASRPRASQLGAWASRQSEPLVERAELERRYLEFEQKFEGGPVTRPPHWGGYALVPERIELWSGQVGRMHDRGLYVSRPGGWTFSQLFP